MRPALPAMVAAAQAELSRQTQLSPGLSGPFLRGVGMILEVVARDWDSATPDAIARIAELKALLRQGADIAPEPLSTMLTGVVSGVDASGLLRLSELQTIYDRLADAMITLQAWLEEVDEPGATELGRRLDAHVLTVVERQILAGSNPW